MNKGLPIGYDSFRRIIEDELFYVDKSLFIKDIAESPDLVSLITRPRRFGKTLNMTMVKEFFDITVDSVHLFRGLDIADTDLMQRINSCPVLYFSFKDCYGQTSEELLYSITEILLYEFERFHVSISEKKAEKNLFFDTFIKDYELLKTRKISRVELQFCMKHLVDAVYHLFEIKPLLLLDEYDQPIVCSFENGYYEELKGFFANLYGSALKGNDNLYKAVLTGIQRVAKESIFSKLNNILVYTVLDPQYSQYFGLSDIETKTLLEAYQLEFTEQVVDKYHGYRFGNYSMFNPWSILNYALKRKLDNFWVNTSTNKLVRDAIREASESFRESYFSLIQKGFADVNLKLETSFIELRDSYTLWGLLINSGYLTVTETLFDGALKRVAIPNDEVRSEFQSIIANEGAIEVK